VSGEGSVATLAVILQHTFSVAIAFVDLIELDEDWTVLIVGSVFRFEVAMIKLVEPDGDFLLSFDC
jgi:hypothetical protein